MALRDYQEEAVLWLCQTRRGMIQCPAGGGKTRIATTAIDRVARSVERHRPARVTWLANTREQCAQALGALARLPAIGRLCRVRVECWQSGIDLSAEDLVVVDECHHASAPKLATMLAAAPRARWGLSATPLGPDPVKNQALLALFDSRVFEIARQRIVSGGYLSRARVIFHHDTDPGVWERVAAEVPRLLQARLRKYPRLDADEQHRRITWQLCQRYGIVQNHARNRRIIALCGEHADASILILVGTVEHGEALARELPRAVVCHSGMGVKRRRETIGAFRTGALPVMIATSLADEGLDIPRASILVLASAGRSAAKIEQRTGRVLRIFNGKEQGLIHDFVDQCHPMLHAQHRSRLRLYKKLAYDIAV
ncbi:MAG: DEAD/DEAH box helicase [Chthoniobacteraceae bacterium]